MLKQELRAIYKQKRDELTKTELEKLQKSIYEQIFQQDYTVISNIHIFLSIQKFKEVDTQPIINFFRKHKKNIIVSKCNFQDNTLSHYLLEEDTILEPNKYGVPEPVNGKMIAVKEIDLVFIPMLVSDKENYRVGYGKGFYDRFLSECRKDTMFIGLNFFQPVDKIEDVNQFDVSLHQVIYPI